MHEMISELRKATERLRYHERVLKHGRAGGRVVRSTPEQKLQNVQKAVADVLQIYAKINPNTPQLADLNLNFAPDAPDVDILAEINKHADTALNRLNRVKQTTNEEVATVPSSGMRVDEWIESIYGREYLTREMWLDTFVEGSRIIFREVGYELPERIKISVGFPSSNALSTSKQRIGEAWTNTTAGGNDVFISPLLEDTLTMAQVTTHELVHCAVGVDKGHRKPFITCALAVGLTGKPKEMLGGDLWHSIHAEMLAALGPIPHVQLLPPTKEPKTQTSRMIKLECDTCGFTFRAAKKWIEGKSELRCPDRACDGKIPVEAEEGKGDSDE